jgi:hypothetical protein
MSTPTQRSASEERDFRRRTRQRYKALVAGLAAVLYREDPIGIAFGPDDEYMPEVGTIVPRLYKLPAPWNLDDVRDVVHEEMVRWFGADMAGDSARYESIAQAVLAI